MVSPYLERLALPTTVARPNAARSGTLTSSTIVVSLVREGGRMVRTFATASLAAVLLMSSAVASAQPCLPIVGDVTTTQDVSGKCPSTLGVCFTGTLSTNGPLRGDTYFVVLSTSPDPLDPTKLTYTGQLSVLHPNGTVVVFDTTGVVDLLTGTFVETDRAPNATLTITGTTNATLTAFTGTVTGETCAAPVPTR
jgi:hypothetical protein